jgi:SNF2 family DNA or RNA helicase
VTGAATAQHQDFGLVWPAPFFPYQREGVERLRRQQGVLLADEMGLGKTIQAVAALRLLKADSSLATALIVAPVNLVLQWRRQLRAWAPELRLSTAIGAADERSRAWRAGADVYLTGYESLRMDVGSRSPTSPGQRSFTVVVADEAQRLKNSSSELARAVNRVHRERTWALTGTPLENRLDDLVSILGLVAPGRFDPREIAAGLRRTLAEVQLRRRRREVLQDLPPKFAATTYVELGPRQRAAYRRAVEDGLVRLGRLGRELRITHVLELILRLKQLCNFCPESDESAKLDDLRRRLDDVVNAGEKALIFSQFVEEPFGARRLARELRSFSPLLYTGAVDRSSRDGVIAEFDRSPRAKVIILSMRAGGSGLNLTSASHVFHFDRWWNPAVETQAEDRVHRIGQARDVYVHAYLAVDTIEERVQEIISDKQALFSDVIDGVETSRLSRLDIESLMGALRPA